MAAWATVSFIDHLKPIGDQIQEELDQLEAGGLPQSEKRKLVSLPFFESLPCPMPWKPA